MHIATLVSVLDQPHEAAEHLHRWGLRDVEGARQVLAELAETGLTLDLLADLCRDLGEHLPQLPDPDASLAALGRYLQAARSPLALVAHWERDPASLPLLLSALSIGPRWARLLCRDPEAYDLLRQAGGQPLAREAFVGDVLAEVLACAEERQVVAAIARLRARHLLRIAYGDLVGGWNVETVMQQLSLLADALVEAALAAAQRKALETRPLPPQLDVRRLRAAVVAVGQHGAGELDYCSPLELLVVYDAPAGDASGQRAVHEHFDRVGKLLVRLLTEPEGGAGYEVRLLSLPESAAAAAAHSVQDIAVAFDSFGRTWHRQSLLKGRSVAGDLALGAELLSRLQDWLFRRYLSQADETGIKALKRRIVMEATLHQDDWRSPRLARGGLRDLERAVEFLQLLAGGDEPAVRTSSTRAAIAGLAKAGVLSADECQILEETHTVLRRLEHRLQTVLAEPAGELPSDSAAQAPLAHWLRRGSSAEDIAATLIQTENRCWSVLRRLLDSAFEQEPPPPREVELLLDPAPPVEEVRAALSPFGFARPAEALATLNVLAAEQVPFLSTRRCRHLLASILPRLLPEIGATPNPDRTLDNLAQVTNSLGGRGVLWDLFRTHPPLLALYVRLCAGSPYLSEILTTNPGMLDELLDSLQLDKLPTRDELEATLDELCRGAQDTLSVLHDFKNAQHLRIGVRDLLGKEDVDRTHEALADVAEICLGHVAEIESHQLVAKFGRPALGPGPFEGEPCRLVIVGLGKLGGREPNYHSNLDILLLYEGEGTTRPLSRSRQAQRTANNHFFTQLAQRIIKELSQLTPKGRLYVVEPLLRPIGVGGALAMSLADFGRHFAHGAAPLWQWQALCQARPVYGEPAVRQSAARLIRQLLMDRPTAISRAELRRSRLQLEKGASPQNLKRGPGGTLDVEFLVQMLQLEVAKNHSQALDTNTQAAIGLLAAAGAIPGNTANQLGESYRFLRRVESGLRLLNTSARHDLPGEAEQLRQLALLLGHSNPERLREQCLDHMAANRKLFNLHTAADN